MKARTGFLTKRRESQLAVEELLGMGFSRLRTLDVRLLGAVAASAFAMVELANSDSASGRPRTQVAPGEPGAQITSFALSPSGKAMATTDSTGRATLRVRDHGWRIDRVFDFPGYASSSAFSPDGRFLATVGYASCICLWDLTAPASPAVRAMTNSIQRAKCAKFSPDGRFLAVTTDHDGTILLWDLAAGREHRVLHHPSRVVIIAFSPDGKWIASGGGIDDRSILLWNPQTGARQTLLANAPGSSTALAFSPDAELLASANLLERSVRLWDFRARRQVRVFEGHERSVNSVAFSPDGSLLATAGNDGMLGLWTVATGERRVTIDAGATCLRTLAFSPDGQTLMLATEDDDDVRLWNLAETFK